MKKTLLRESAKRDVEGGETSLLLHEADVDRGHSTATEAGVSRKFTAGLSRRTAGKGPSGVGGSKSGDLQSDGGTFRTSTASRRPSNVYTQLFKNVLRSRIENGYRVDVSSFRVINRMIRSASIVSGVCALLSIVLGIFQSGKGLHALNDL